MRENRTHGSEGGEGQHPSRPLSALSRYLSNESELSAPGISSHCAQYPWGRGSRKRFYENALAYEVRATDLSAVQQFGAKVHYKDMLVGEYFVDLLINEAFGRVEDRQSTGRRASNAMLQLSESDRSGTMPAA